MSEAITISVTGNRLQITLSTHPLDEHYGEGELPGDIAGEPKRAVDEFAKALDEVYRSGEHKYIETATYQAFGHTIQKMAGATKMYVLIAADDGVRYFESGIDEIKNFSLN